MKRTVLLVLLALCLLLAAPALAERTNRMLLVGCDRFVTHEDTAPASAQNVVLMEKVLTAGAMNPETVITRRSGLSGVAALEALISEAYAGADEDDVSYFYISTHGLWEDGMRAGSMALVLSDGRREENLTAAHLRSLLDTVPGTKVLIIDACHSGAMIGKGVDAGFENVFTGSDYKVICSSGGAEESWFWRGAESDSIGAGYFSAALESGLSASGYFGADANRDGTISLNELQRYLIRTHGASTVRVYPEEDSFAVFLWDVSAASALGRSALISGFTLQDALLDGAFPEAAFSFTAHRSLQMAYQIVLRSEDERWDFDDARLIWDTTEPGIGYGVISAGLKERVLSLQRDDEESGGYALLQLITLEDGEPLLLSSPLLCITPLTGDPQLRIDVQAVFSPEAGEELGLVVRHSLPCALSVTVESEDGSAVRRLLTGSATRPEGLLEAGTALCWNGRLADGSMAEAGSYHIRARAVIGDEKYEAVSEWFRLE